MGVNIDLLDVGSIEDGAFFVKFRVSDRKSDFKWVLVAVYGVAQPKFKESFLTELVQAYIGETQLSSSLLLLAVALPGSVATQFYKDLGVVGPVELLYSMSSVVQPSAAPPQ
jgi:hypothetical protein